MELAPAHEEFLAYLDLEANRSPQTVTAYASDFRQFLLCLTETDREPVGEAIDRQTIRQYVAWLRRRGLSVTSICRRLASLRSFWRFLGDNGYTDRDPFVRVSIPKRARSLPVALSAPEAQALLQAAERQPSIYRAFRDRAALSVLLFTGLRRAELLALRLPDVDLGEGTLRIEHGKGDKTRLVPLGERPLSALRDWLDLRPGCDHDFLFLSSDRRPLGRRALMGLLRKALRRAGIDRPGVVLHSLRHTAATLLLQGGCDLASVQRILGHSSLNTTGVYLQVTMHDLRRAVARHPLAVPGEEVDRPPFALRVAV